VLTTQSEGRTNSLLCSREHQDAQELFQLLSECIKNDIAAVDREGYRDRGLGGLGKTSESNREIGKSVFDGLTANRRSCITCGYTEAVMHFAFDNWQLSVPRMAVSLLPPVHRDKLTPCLP
jgi:ubiquitin carboxyl-terminal hydrolase 1